MSTPLPDKDRLDEIDRAFDEALDLTTTARAAFVAAVAKRDPSLADAVARLLADEGAADSRLLPGSGLNGLALADDGLTGGANLTPGSRLGRYRIVRELGRGGMAVVYLAERADGAFEQQVAIKRLRCGLAAPSALYRFHRERQILATLTHPSIARLLDGGVDDEGWPYLVMEYVDGQPIDRFADARTLTIPQRLDLFVRVARAVDFAHRHLVVHRDIKPSNVLVTHAGDVGEVKLLDFGIAKLLDGDASDDGIGDAMATRTFLRALTPEYASPEQLSGDRITIASDVYQLGLLLHELLSGVRAPARESRSADAPRRISVAVAGSSRRDALAQARGTHASALVRRLRGDLDNIVARALDPVVDSRYPTAAALVDDVQRHLSGQAVAARGEARWYRAMRFARRHTIGLAASVAIALLVAAIAVISTIQASRLARERDRVALEAAKAQGVTRFLLGLFEIPPTAEANYASLSARDVLEYRAARVDDLSNQPPAVEAEIRSTVGYALLRLGSHDRGLALIQRSLELRRQHLGDEHVDTAESLHRLGTGLNMKGQYEAAEQHLRRALAIRERMLGQDHVEVAETLTELAVAISRRSRLTEAEQLLNRALTIDRAAANDYQARVLNNLGLVKVGLGDDEAAIAAFAAAIDYRRKRFGDLHPDLPTNLTNLARVYLRRHEPAQAIPLLEQALAGVRRVYGDAHANTDRIRTALMTAYRDAGDPRAAATAGVPPRQP